MKGARRLYTAVTVVLERVGTKMVVCLMGRLLVDLQTRIVERKGKRKKVPEARHPSSIELIGLFHIYDMMAKVG